MSPHDHFQSGRLAEALAAQTAEVKSNPTDVERRYTLFAFLCFAGELERADKQLDVLTSIDPKIEVGSRIYRQLLASEMQRRRVYEGTAEPMLPPTAPLHANLRLEALAQHRSGNRSELTTLLDRAAEASPDLSGFVNDRAFQSMGDADGLLGSVLEVFAGGRYLWLPFEEIRSLTLDAPRHLLDLLWTAADLVDREGTEASVHIPATYALTSPSVDDAIRLGRATIWSYDSGWERGQGQRLLDVVAADPEKDPTTEIPWLSIRSLRFDDATSPPPGA